MFSLTNVILAGVGLVLGLILLSAMLLMLWPAGRAGLRFRIRWREIAVGSVMVAAAAALSWGIEIELSRMDAEKLATATAKCLRDFNGHAQAHASAEAEAWCNEHIEKYLRATSSD